VAIYKVVYKEFHQMTISNTQSFDTSDQSAWERFLQKAATYGVDISEFPLIAPQDPKDWFELVSQLPHETFDERKEDLWTANSGDFNTIFELEDEVGNTIDLE
jgi:hypothetical protein